MISRVIAAALVLLLSGRYPLACSGKVLLSAAGGAGKDHVSIKRGQELSRLDHLLRDPTTGDIVVCNKKHCYPAFGLDQHQRPQEIVRLEGCNIADASTQEDGLERHKIGDIESEGAPRGDSVRRRVHRTNDQTKPAELRSTGLWPHN